MATENDMPVLRCLGRDHAEDIGIARLEAWTGQKCPLSYRQFLERCNGCTIVNGSFAIGITSARAGEDYQENEDTKVHEFFPCDADSHDDLLQHQSDYFFNQWVPRCFLAVGWNPGTTQICIHFKSGVVGEWLPPDDPDEVPKVMSEEEVMASLEIIGGDWLEVMQKLRVVNEDGTFCDWDRIVGHEKIT